MINKSLNIIVVLGLALTMNVYAADDTAKVIDDVGSNSPQTKNNSVANKVYREFQDKVNSRDPFAPTEEILTSQNDKQLRLTPLLDQTQIPKMRMMGLMRQNDGEVAALLDVEGAGVHMVHVGDTIGLYNEGYKTVIQILQINRLNVVVEAGSLGQQIVVR